MPPSSVFAGRYYFYLVADDGVNDPVFTVSGFFFDVGAPITAVEAVTWGEVKGRGQH